MEGYDREFWQFSDQLRLQTAGFSGLSLGGSIWSPAANANDRRNADPALFSPADGHHDFPFSAAAKNGGGLDGPGLIGTGKLAFGATTTSKADRYNNVNLPSDNKPYSGGNSYGVKVNNNNNFAFNKMGSYGYNGNNNNNNGGNREVKSHFNKSIGRPASNNHYGGHGHGKKGGGDGKKKHAKNEINNNNNGTAAVDKRFKTLPASEALPRNEAIGGYIFVCNNDTMEENLKRQLFGLQLTVHGQLDGIANKLATSLTDGISTDEDLLNQRQKIYGVNKFTESEVRSFWEFVWEALQDTTLIILTACAFVSLVVGIAMEGWPEGAHDGIGIVASILLVVSVTATSDYQQSLQFRDLDKEKRKILVQVTRNGFRQRILTDDLLPGDVVHLAVGDQVPTDGLFISGFSVLVDESSLTGESEPVVVNEDNPFLLSGTKVLDGSFKMLVTAVGMRTQWGKLMAVLTEGGDDETPLQVKLNGVANIIGKIGLFFAVLTFVVLSQGLIGQKYHDGLILSWSGDDVLEILEHFAVAVTIVVVAVPEGLPLAVTLSLAFAMKKMMNDKALVRQLAACETMGSATVICSDKTGTLTTNRMTVVKACISGNTMEVNGPQIPSSLCSRLPEVAVRTLLESIFNNTSGEVVINQDGKHQILGTPTEAALLEFALSLGGDYKEKRQETKIVKVEPFNSTKKRMSVILELPEGGYRAHCKGAAEIVLASCDKFIDDSGSIVPLDERTANKFNDIIETFSSEALRTLCLAYREMEEGFSTHEQISLKGYTCIGIVGIKDPVRPGVKQSVATCRSAGIAVRMVTGDNINTAKAIARECGILTKDGLAIEGAEFREKNPKELLELIPKMQVLARSSPLDKHTLVKHLRTTFNEVVAVTGDGTNDAPALREADIGLAMGIAGTEVAKESADVVILDDNFSTIVTVGKWGRSVYINIQKFVQFQLTVNVVALLVNFSSACFTGDAPLTAVQLLWVNMIMDTLGALALATEPPNDNLMKKAPVGRTGKFITNVMWRNILGQSLYQFAVMWYLQTQGKYVFGLEGSMADTVLNTIIFNTFVFCQVLNEISSREMEEINVLKGMSQNSIFVGVLTGTSIFQFILVQFLGDFANTTPLTQLQWLVSVLFGFLGMPIAAAIKLIPVEPREEDGDRRS